MRYGPQLTWDRPQQLVRLSNVCSAGKGSPRRPRAPAKRGWRRSRKHYNEERPASLGVTATVKRNNQPQHHHLLAPNRRVQPVGINSGLPAGTEHIIEHRGRACEASRDFRSRSRLGFTGSPCRRRSSSPLAPQCPEHQSQSACLFGSALTGNLLKAGAHQAQPVGPSALRSRPYHDSVSRSPPTPDVPLALRHVSPHQNRFERVGDDLLV
jgi:hypothetical protein